MTVSNELADVLKQACQEVEKWHPWQRSLDPEGSQAEKRNAVSSEQSAPITEPTQG
jgi:hypothetical protein